MDVEHVRTGRRLDPASRVTALFSVVLAIAVVTRRDLRDATERVQSATNA